MANEPSKANNREDAKLSGSGKPVEEQTSGPAMPVSEMALPRKNNQLVSGKETEPTALIAPQPIAGTPPIEAAMPPTEMATPPAQPPAEQTGTEVPVSANHSGVLVDKEIRDQKLIRVPESGREEERCYQPTSYDLRLGAEYVMPTRDGQLVIHSCIDNGMLTIAPFGTSIVSTYEWVALPSNVVGRFNLRVQHAFEGLLVQMGTQVEPNYNGPLYALLHNISNRPKTLKFRDYDTRPFTIEFSYTSQPSRLPDERKKQRKTFSDFIPPNYARGGLDLVLEDIHRVQEENTRLSQDLNAKKMLGFTGVALILIIATATLFIPWTLAKFTYDKDYFPLVSADAIATMKYGPNHSNDADIVKQVMQQLDARSSGAGIIPREQFYAERLTQLKNRRDLIKRNPAQVEELKSIEKQINEIAELLKN